MNEAQKLQRFLLTAFPSARVTVDEPLRRTASGP